MNRIYLFMMGAVFLSCNAYSVTSMEDWAYEEWFSKIKSDRSQRYLKLYESKVCRISPNIRKAEVLIKGYERLDYGQQEQMVSDICRDNAYSEGTSALGIAIIIATFSIVAVVIYNYEKIDLVCGLI